MQISTSVGVFQAIAFSSHDDLGDAGGVSHTQPICALAKETRMELTTIAGTMEMFRFWYSHPPHERRMSAGRPLVRQQKRVVNRHY
jgi:hypothetical protein